MRITHHAPGLVGDIAPAMRDTLREGDASPGRRLEDFLADRDAVGTRDDHKMLFLAPMKMHRRGTTGSCNGFNDRIRAVRIETGESYRDTLPAVGRCRSSYDAYCRTPALYQSHFLHLRRPFRLSSYNRTAVTRHLRLICVKRLFDDIGGHIQSARR
jgi:hypothetical protein